MAVMDFFAIPQGMEAELRRILEQYGVKPEHQRWGPSICGGWRCELLWLSPAQYDAIRESS